MLSAKMKNTFSQKLIYYFSKWFIPDKALLQLRFRKRLKRKLNLKKPEKYNDKLQWLKLNWYNPLATKCADKYEVREYIEEKISSKYLNDLFAVYENVDEIKLEELPNSFVLKSTHGTSEVIICRDKNKFDLEKQKKIMKGWLKKNIYWTTREWVYRDIKPRIICEKLLNDSTGDLLDYKIFCFDGEPKLIQVDFDRFNNHKRNIYDLEWNLLENIEINYESDPGTIIEKPKNLDKMLELSRILSEDFPHVRVDFYNMDGKIIFGELTFFPGSGLLKFNSEEFELKMGQWLKL